MSYIKQTEKEVREALLFLRKNNSTVPSETIKFILDASLEKLKVLTLVCECGKPIENKHWKMCNRCYHTTAFHRKVNNN